MAQLSSHLRIHYRRRPAVWPVLGNGSDGALCEHHDPNQLGLSLASGYYSAMFLSTIIKGGVSTEMVSH